MKCDVGKTDQMVFGLMCLGLHDANRAWKTFDWACLNRLFAQGLISNSIGKTKSVFLTEAGKKKAQELFKEYCCD